MLSFGQADPLDGSGLSRPARFCSKMREIGDDPVLGATQPELQDAKQ